jgi:hypothetical protein
MALILSSQGLRLDRAPRLRRIADLIDQQADRARFPARARRLARDMRVRATELELGGYDLDPVNEYTEEIRAIGFH